MRKNTTGFMFYNFLLFRVIALILLAAGIATSSLPLLITAGIVTYGGPCLCVHLRKSDTKRGNTRLPELVRRTTNMLSLPSRIAR
ncbi:MAG: hypothetical protein LBI62_07680 [Candidatus Accumulibacter sp.]|nr:hypothetical protein [Accumulibacter sp.]